MAQLKIDFEPDTDTTYARLLFRQEGKKGYVLSLCYLPEFLEALESPISEDIFFFIMNYGVCNTSTSCNIIISTQQAPLLSLSRDQSAKLVVHLKDKYSSFL